MVCAASHRASDTTPHAPVTKAGKAYPGGNREYRHNDGMNVTFFDGHAHWYRPEQIPCSKEKCWWAIENHH